MKTKDLIIILSLVTGAILGGYIMGVESSEPEMADPHAGHSHEPEVQVANRGERKVTLKDGYEQIGLIQARVPKTWKREQPSSSMRIAQFAIPGKNGAGEMIVFSGIGGSVDANLERWYGQFKPEGDESVSEGAEKKHFHVNELETTISFATGTYLKSSMGMGGAVSEMKNYALLAAIIIAPDGPYYFKGTGPLSTMEENRHVFDAFVQSIEKL